MIFLLLLYFIITAAAQTVSKAAPNLLIPNPPDNAIATVWTFDNNTGIENLAVRANGEILCTSTDRAAIYLVNPFLHVAFQVHQFEPTDGPLGITEISNDVFAVVTANISEETISAWPGSAKIWRVDMAAYTLAQTSVVTSIGHLPDVGFPNGIASPEGEVEHVLVADSTKGLIWRVSALTGAYNIAINDTALEVVPGPFPLGVNGLKHGGFDLFFTNTASGVVGYIPTGLNDSETGPATTLAHVDAPDDFDTSAGSLPLYVVGSNTLWRVDTTGSTVLAGGQNDSTLLGATSIAYGRVNVDRGVWYISTRGGNGSGGKILAVNVFVL